MNKNMVFITHCQSLDVVCFQSIIKVSIFPLQIEKVILALNDRLQHLEKLNGVTLKHRGNGDGA